jgi:hypothetical protein
MPANIGDTQIEIDPCPGYVPAGMVLSFEGVLVKLAQPLYAGSTIAYAQAPISGVIATGTTAIVVVNSPPAVILPYQQVVFANAVGAGAVSVLSQPVAEQAVIVASVVVVGEGAAEAEGELGLSWDNMSEEQWNTLNEEDWALLA